MRIIAAFWRRLSDSWRQLGSFWAEHDNEPDKADYYFRQLVWYDRELQKDDYVIGGTVFTSYSPTPLPRRVHWRRSA